MLSQTAILWLSSAGIFYVGFALLIAWMGWIGSDHLNPDPPLLAVPPWIRDDGRLCVLTPLFWLLPGLLWPYFLLAFLAQAALGLARRAWDHAATKDHFCGIRRSRRRAPSGYAALLEEGSARPPPASDHPPVPFND